MKLSLDLCRNALQYSDSVEVLSGLSDHDLSESQLLASTMGIEPTNYRCDTGRAMLAIHCWIRLALSFHVVFIDTIFEHTAVDWLPSIAGGSSALFPRPASNSPQCARIWRQ